MLQFNKVRFRFNLWAKFHKRGSSVQHNKVVQIITEQLLLFELLKENAPF